MLCSDQATLSGGAVFRLSRAFGTAMAAIYTCAGQFQLQMCIHVLSSLSEQNLQCYMCLMHGTPADLLSRQACMRAQAQIHGTGLHNGCCLAAAPHMSNIACCADMYV